MPPTEVPAPGTLLQGVFAGPQEFAQLVRDALCQASVEGWNEMVWSDPSFEEWPLREQQVVQSLDVWARRGRKLTLLARRYDAMVQLHPRFVAWRQRWDHLLDCRVCRSIDDAQMPSALWSPVWVLHRTDPERCRGNAGYEPSRRRALQEALAERRRQSTVGFSASVLGL
ncbi:hypothetical protein [Rhodoferax sp.]|jgi:hypothetical protein|uniref:hypothetical protein n=1 Tax=Rhodoferax sp. TaxID=50421 RepID=UPI003783B881